MTIYTICHDKIFTTNAEFNGDSSTIRKGILHSELKILDDMVDFHKPGRTEYMHAHVKHCLPNSV